MPTGSWTGTFCSAAAPSSTDEFAIFSYHDDDNTNDIPDTEAAIGSGFSNANAFFIGNDQLRKSELTGLKLCIEVRPSCHFSQCVDIYESEWTYSGADEHIGRLEFPSNLHRIAWALSGQASDGIDTQSDTAFVAKAFSDPAWWCTDGSDKHIR